VNKEKEERFSEREEEGWKLNKEMEEGMFTESLNKEK
jgi:hypothetical protein